MPSVTAHGIADDAVAAPFVQTLTLSPGTNPLLVVWVSFESTHAPPPDTVTITYNGTPLTVYGFNSAISGVPTFQNSVGWTTTPASGSATLSVDTNHAQVVATLHVAWALFSDVHQTSPVRWAFFDGGPGTPLGFGPATGTSHNAYASSSDLVYGNLLAQTAGPLTFTPGAGVTSLDASGVIVGATVSHQAVHGYRAGDNTDQFNLTWTTGTAPNFGCGVVVLRHASDVVPVTAGTYAWGDDNRFGGTKTLLPYGDTFNRWGDPRNIGDFQIATANDFLSAVGIALGKDGFPYTWGDDTYGVRGNGTTGTPLTTPLQLATYAGTTDVAAGAGTLFWLSAGVLYGLGANSFGEFANGTTTASASVVTIAPPLGSTPSLIAAGNGALFLLDTAGKVWHVGAASLGQRGDGSTATDHYTAWAQVGSYAAYTMIESGEKHVVALRGDGKVDTWGSNSHGQCGQGTLGTAAALATLSSPTGIVDISAYGNDSAVIASGTISTWGQGDIGQVGRGIATNNPTPGPVSTLAGSTPSVLSKKANSGRDLLWIGTDKRLYGSGDSFSGQLDPYWQASNYYAPALLLSDRLGPTWEWCSSMSSSVTNNFVSTCQGIFLGGVPVRARAFCFLCGV